LWIQSLFVVLEPPILIGLTSFWINGRPLVPPKLNSKRAALVLSKIDEILTWEKSSDRDRDTQLTCARLMNTWRGSSRNRGARLIT